MFATDPFMGIQRGAKVTFTVRRPGVGYLRDVKTARVNPLLIFDTHVCVCYGSCGTVVNADNYLRHEQPK